MSLYYCKKCGRLVQNTMNEENFRCDCCQTITDPVPAEFLGGTRGLFFKDDDTEQWFIDKYIKSSPTLDPYLFEHRDEILAEKSAKLKAQLEYGKAIQEEKSRVPKCPSCGSSNISKIGIINRAVSTHFFGLASSKIGKTHKCNHCGTTW